MSTSFEDGGTGAGAETIRVRVYAGQPDPADSARFTVVYFVNDEQGHLDGRLREDGSLEVVIRDGPLQGRE